MIDSADQELAGAGVGEPIETALADAGVWNTEQIADVTARGIRTLVSPDNRRRKTPGQYRQRKDHYVQMREQLATEAGHALYARRKQIIEPVFGQVKHNRRIDRFTRRGLAACRAEWRLVMATHNLLKLFTHSPAIATA
jgi:Transposase DDE domain